VRNIAIIAFLFMLLTAAAVAQIPTKGNIFFGYSYASADLGSGTRVNTNGWDGSLEGKFLPWVGIVADVSGHYGSENFLIACQVFPGCPPPVFIHADASEHDFLFGPRVSVSVGKLRPFAEALFGAGHVSVNNGFGSDTSFATALGGGVDYRLIHGIAWRVQGDYLQTRFFNRTQNNLRISTGLVLNF
jgi:opacity protein-like surface antigen